MQSMYLSTIPNDRKNTSLNRDSLQVNDIDGARCRFLQKPIKPRATFAYCNTDIEKSASRQLVPKVVNRINTSLFVDDIPGARTKIGKFTTTRQTNPLTPVYQIPVVQYEPVSPSKFIRDTMEIDDIDGVRSKLTFAIKMQRAGKFIDTKKEVMERIHSRKRGFNRPNSHNDISLGVKDINIDENHVKPTRCVNPLEPKYMWEGKVDTEGIEGASALKPKPSLPTYSLSTYDIEGATKKVNNFMSVPKEQIEGTRAESYKRGMKSKRMTNPLQPKYDYPGWNEKEVVQVSMDRKEGQKLIRPKTALQRFDQFVK